MPPCLVPSWPQIMQIRILFRSRSDLVLISFWMLTMLWIFYPISFYRRVSRFVVFQTKVAHSCFFSKLKKAVAVQNSLLEKFSGKFRRCWKILHRFSGSTKCYPCQGLRTFRQGKRLLENWPRLRERCWIFASETATAVLSSSEFLPCSHKNAIAHMHVCKRQNVGQARNLDLQTNGQK